MTSTLSCCLTGRQDASPNGVAVEPRVGRGIGAERVFFRGGPSFVGTDHPEIPQDGEGPKRDVVLTPFWLETTSVTNARFAAFVAESGYVTQAELFGWSPVFRGLLGSDAPPPSAGLTPWWVRVDGASWAAPEGPGSTIVGREDHPAVHVSWADARTYAAWCGGRLPTEAEWEHAARGGLVDPRFPWGEDEPDDQTVYANIWQGQFPDTNILTDGYLGTSPVKAFPANGAGLYGMSGNVWEWTADPFRVRLLSRHAKMRNENAGLTREKVVKGGSFLCHISYCYRYRIASRSALTAESSASNVGIRVAYDGSPGAEA